MPSHRTETFRPPAFSDRSDEYHVETLRNLLPRRWTMGERDSVESIGVMLGETRDHQLYRKIGAETWADYCTGYLRASPEAIDALIQCVRLLTAPRP